MKVILLILLAFGAVVALATWISNKFSGKNKEAEQEEEDKIEIPTDCCGAHEVCEFEEMLKNPEEIVYYEDEELDRFRGIAADAYTDEQIDEFREVLYTLKDDEIRMWLLSIERRQLQLPQILRQEAMLLFAEVSQ
ncbi:hypothetical protein [Maribellus sediminis]|uniref:hypothetical protein n=1 Tax=Maribellus sediminis TaxID=2696285 RepID=UPI00142FCCD0|nr:hypothetical protein [Maribellus sediminis]